MNILIIGEFSGFAKHLKDGFEKLGHRVVITLNGDIWKGFKPTGEDIFYSTTPWMMGKRHIPGSTRIKAIGNNRRIEIELRKRFLTRPDLIVVINYRFITDSIFKSGVKVSTLKSMKKAGTRIIMSICGGDPAEEYTYPELHRTWGINLPLRENRYFFLLDNADVIIPTNIYYYNSITNYVNYYNFDVSKVVHSIPLPIKVENSVAYSGCEGRKIIIFHGIIRPKEKGTPFIQEAMTRIQNEFPDKVECICKGGMPYDEYVKLFERIDILIDQTYGTGWGMNATIGAMNYKCVLAPCSPENCVEMNIPNIPFVQIGPDSELIYQKLKALVLNPQEIDRIKLESRKFVEHYCSSDIVAQRYINAVNDESI